MAPASSSSSRFAPKSLGAKTELRIGARVSLLSFFSACLSPKKIFGRLGIRALRPCDGKTPSVFFNTILTHNESQSTEGVVPDVGSVH